MTDRKPLQWQIVNAKLKTARERGVLGIVAAMTKIPEYRLHDAAKGEIFLQQKDIRRLYEYFEGKQQ